MWLGVVAFYYPITDTDTIRASISITKITPSTINSTATNVVMKVTTDESLACSLLIQNSLHIIIIMRRWF